MDRKARKTRILGVALGVLLSAGLLIGCTAGSEGPEGQDLAGSEMSDTREGAEGGGEHGGGESSGEGRESGGEHGSGEGDGEHGPGDGEHGPEGEGSGEGSDGGSEANERAMSSPIVPLDQEWEGVLGGLAVTARYDQATRTVYTTARNTLSHVLCYVQTEPHIKSGTRTVGELGPGVMGHLSPGEAAASVLAVADEPSLAGVSYDGLVTHMEVFDCGGAGPVPHSAEGGEGGREGAGGEGHGPEGEGASEGGGEHGSGGEEGSAAMLGVGQTFDQVRGGARLILRYHPPSNSFRGTVENTTNGVLTRVRVEVHLSNGTELGPTTPQDLAAGKSMAVRLDAAGERFTGWTPHAEVGPQSSGGGEGSEGSEGSGGEGGSEGAEGPEAAEGEGAGGAGEEGGTRMAPDVVFDGERKGSRLILGYVPEAGAFVGAVGNISNATLEQVRVEVHLYNRNNELGPTTPIDLAPGQWVPVWLPDEGTGFSEWVPHAEVGAQQPGSGESGGEGGEGSGGEGGSEGSGGEHGAGGEGGSS